MKITVNIPPDAMIGLNAAAEAAARKAMKTAAMTVAAEAVIPHIEAGKLAYRLSAHVGDPRCGYKRPCS